MLLFCAFALCSRNECSFSCVINCIFRLTPPISLHLDAVMILLLYYHVVAIPVIHYMLKKEMSYRKTQRSQVVKSRSSHEFAPPQKLCLVVFGSSSDITRSSRDVDSMTRTIQSKCTFTLYKDVGVPTVHVFGFFCIAGCSVPQCQYNVVILWCFKRLCHAGCCLLLGITLRYVAKDAINSQLNKNCSVIETTSQLSRVTQKYNAQHTV